MEIIRERQRVTDYYYEREFTDQPHCGFGFPCDENGNLLPNDNPTAILNFQDCINGKYPHLIDRGVRKFAHTYTEPAIGICDNCGANVELVNEYYGTCQCPNCDAWYTLSGQSVLAPSQYDIDSNY